LIKKAKYPVLVFLFYIISILILSHFEILTPVISGSLFYSAGLVALNFILFLIFWEFSRNKPNKTFLIFNLGGMVLRLLLTLIGVFVVIKFLNIDKYAFIFALFIWYILFLSYEVNLFRKKAEKP